jgi:hypothetical protein
VSNGTGMVEYVCLVKANISKDLLFLIHRLLEIAKFLICVDC